MTLAQKYYHLLKMTRLSDECLYNTMLYDLELLENIHVLNNEDILDMLLNIRKEL